jgi:hypothetical protein
VAVLVAAVSAFLNINYRTRLLAFFFILAVAVLAIFATLSRTGILALVLVLVFYGVGSGLKHLHRGLLIRPVIMGLTTIGVLAGLLYFLSATVVGELLMQRMSASVSRLDRWVELMELERFVRSLFLGQGGVVLGDGKVIKPHNGHFHLFFGFGLLVYSFFVYVFFRVRNRMLIRYLFVLPLFLGFTVNVGIYEPRFAGIMAILIGAYAAVSERGRKRVYG